MVGASRQSGGAAVAASTEKLNTHSADIMRVDVLTAHTPFCPLAAWLQTRSKYAIAENQTFVLLNVVRHNSDHLYRVTSEIIAPF